MTEKIVLGTRGSDLALAQTYLVEKAIHAARPELRIEMKIIATKGDSAKVVDVRAGRKGLFTAEIERALLAGDVDLAVHSAKDLPSEINRGAEIAAVLPRARTDDVLISKHSGGLAGLPNGATVATGSVRRTRQLHWRRPDLQVVDLRGNVPTRLRKLAENDWDAIVLARAGLERLGLSLARNEINFERGRFFVEILSREIFLPAGGQGIIALQVRTDDESSREIVDPINDRETLLCLEAEREFLRLLSGDCGSPVGVLGTIDGSTMTIRAQVFEPPRVEPRTARVDCEAASPTKLARELWEAING